MPCQLYHMGLILGYKELKSCISFNVSIFFYNLHDLPQKKNYTPLLQKKKSIFL